MHSPSSTQCTLITRHGLCKPDKAVIPWKKIADLNQLKAAVLGAFKFFSMSQIIEAQPVLPAAIHDSAIFESNALKGSICNIRISIFISICLD